MKASVQASQNATRASAQYWKPQTYWHKPREDTPAAPGADVLERHVEKILGPPLRIAPPNSPPPPDMFTAQVCPFNLGLIDSLLLNVAYFRSMAEHAEILAENGQPPPYEELERCKYALATIAERPNGEGQARA